MSDCGYLPPKKIPVAQQRKIDQLCIGFENQWRQNPNLRIETFDARIDDLWRANLLVELMMTEVDLRFHAGEDVSAEEYHRRFPAFANFVRTAFERLPRKVEFLELPSDHSVVNTQSTAVNLNVGASDSVNQQSPLVADSTHDRIPINIGNFVVQDPIGNGSFGIVFRAWDKKHHRHVALKFPRSNQVATARELESFLQEGEAARQLDHPGIVRTYEVCQSQGFVFIVQELIVGRSLKALIEESLPPEELIRIVSTICDAVAFAHRLGIYHRDLKPSNVLVDQYNHPYVVDFGTAIQENIQRRRRGERAGSPAYMSPELVRGESHLIDGRSDIWSLGVMLYELLRGRRPFSGDGLPEGRERMSELFHEIKYREAAPLRQYDSTISPELERICLRCLAKRISDRYLTANDLADDLRQWLKDPDYRNVEAEISVVPQGLRSFGADQSGFFARLLPGLRDRRGVPLSIRFWVTRIEEHSLDRSFSVGFVYGPSGAGKSSFVKAGVLPRLSSKIIQIYVECTSRDTEVRLLKALRERFDTIPNKLSLLEVLGSIREGHWIPRNCKVLLVFDQFEQWLHARDVTLDEQLIQALRHSDGKVLQSLILVRDDFWLAISRFKNAMDVEMIDGVNAMLIDRFEIGHARQVLIEFGKAFGQLPMDPAALTKKHIRFLDLAVEGLAEDHHVISVRLSLFAEIFKNRSWTPHELQAIGGIAGVGETFLEETFSSKTASPKYRQLEKTVRVLLETLLPESGTDIRGHMKSYGDLLDASPFDQRTIARFEELIETLDKELRLITPTDPDAANITGDSIGKPHFQLTHDYLVHSVRRWLDRKKSGSWQGRAELKLVELASHHSRKEQREYLPSLVDYLCIQRVVPVSRRTASQNRLMKAAARRHGMVVFILGMLTIAALSISVMSYHYFHNRVAGELTTQFLTSPPQAIELVLARMKPYRKRITRHIANRSDSEDYSRNGLRNEMLKFWCRQDRTLLLKRLLSQTPNIAVGEMQAVSATFLSAGDFARTAATIEEAFKQTADPTARVRYAFLMFEAGELHLVKEVFKLDTYRTDRTLFIHQFGEMGGNIEHAVSVLGKSETRALVSGLLLTISVCESSLPAAHASRLDDISMSLYCNADPREIHGAAKYALEMRGIPLPKPAPGGEDREWFVNKTGLTMVKIDGGTVVTGIGMPDTLRHLQGYKQQSFSVESLYVSDIELPIQLLEQCMNDTSYKGPKPDPAVKDYNRNNKDCPVDKATTVL